jgi:hypothetical protein
MKTVTGLRLMGGSGKPATQHALDAAETITHIAYALRAEDGQHARWVQCGTVRIVNGRGAMRLDTVPHPPETFTGDICLCPVGEEPPPPILDTMERLAPPPLMFGDTGE